VPQWVYQTTPPLSPTNRDAAGSLHGTAQVAMCNASTRRRPMLSRPSPSQPPRPARPAHKPHGGLYSVGSSGAHATDLAALDQFISSRSGCWTSESRRTWIQRLRVRGNEPSAVSPGNAPLAAAAPASSSLVSRVVCTGTLAHSHRD